MSPRRYDTTNRNHLQDSKHGISHGHAWHLFTSMEVRLRLSTFSRKEQYHENIKHTKKILLTVNQLNRSSSWNAFISIFFYDGMVLHFLRVLTSEFSIVIIAKWFFIVAHCTDWFIFWQRCVNVKVGMSCRLFEWRKHIWNYGRKCIFSGFFPRIGFCVLKYNIKMAFVRGKFVSLETGHIRYKKNRKC